MIDVLLTHSYHLFHDRKQVRKMQPYPPLGTLYAAALLRERGFSVGFFDCMLESPEEKFQQAVRQARPRIVAIYEDNFNFLTKMCLSRMRSVAFDMTETAKAHDAKVVINGSDASDHSEEYLDEGADYVLIGEAEWTLLELVEALLGRSGRYPQEIHGLTFRDLETRTIVRTPPRSLMPDLDLLPFPARDLVDVEQYRAAWTSTHGFFSLNIVASRGCPYRCNWCAKPIYGHSFNLRSPECVATEMAELRERYRADHLWFADDLYGIRKDWLQEFADHVEHRRAAMPFKMQSRVDLMLEDSVDALSRAGCAEVWMGVESGSQKILDAMDKDTYVDQIGTATDLLKSRGIRACFFIQFGYPGETWEDIGKTIQLVKDTRPDDIGVSVAYPLPGTEFYERVEKQLGNKSNWVDSEDLAMMFKGAYTSEFYRALHDALHAEVESWSSPLNGHLIVQKPSNAHAHSDVRELWDRVFQLEGRCRNADATEIPEWICS